jgi:hypothetical protein
MGVDEHSFTDFDVGTDHGIGTNLHILCKPCRSMYRSRWMYSCHGNQPEQHEWAIRRIKSATTVPDSCFSYEITAAQSLSHKPWRRRQNFPRTTNCLVGCFNLIVFLGSAAAGDNTCMIQAASNKLRGKELVLPASGKLEVPSRRLGACLPPRAAHHSKSR